MRSVSISSQIWACPFENQSVWKRALQFNQQMAFHKRHQRQVSRKSTDLGMGKAKKSKLMFPKTNLNGGSVQTSLSDRAGRGDVKRRRLVPIDSFRMEARQNGWRLAIRNNRPIRIPPPKSDFPTRCFSRCFMRRNVWHEILAWYCNGAE